MILAADIRMRYAKFRHYENKGRIVRAENSKF